MSLPPGWTERTPDGLLNLYSGDDQANLLVSADPAAESSLDDLAAQYARDIADGLSATIDAGGIESAAVDGSPARRYTYSIPPGTDVNEARGRQIVARHGGRDLVITYTGTPEAFNTFVAELRVHHQLLALAGPVVPAARPAAPRCGRARAPPPPHRR